MSLGGVPDIDNGVKGAYYVPCQKRLRKIKYGLAG